MNEMEEVNKKKKRLDGYINLHNELSKTSGGLPDMT